MGYVIDTNLIIEVENDNKEVIKKLQNYIKDLNGEFYITFFNFIEYFFGHVNKDIKNKEKVIQRIKKYKILNTTNNSALIFCEVKNNLIKKGITIPDFDLLIASLVIDNNLTLITTDKHFEDIKEMKKIIIKV